MGLNPGVRVSRGPQSVSPHEYELVCLVTVDDQEVPWGTLRIGYVVREAVELTQVALQPFETEKMAVMPPALLGLLRRRYLMMWVNSDIRMYRKASRRLEGTVESRPAHRPPLAPDIWVDRADAIVETLDEIVDAIRRLNELDFDDVPPNAYDILRDKWTDDEFDGEPSKEQMANRIQETKKRGYVVGNLRDRSVAFGPAYFVHLDDGQE